MNWTEDQVLAMAPDQASVTAGKAQAKAEKWLSLCYNEKAIWGKIKGSGKNPYQAIIDTTEIAFKCSCPSRKFPCKHGLGLALIHARSTDKFQAKEAPDWVEQWLSKREQKKEQKKKEQKDKPLDEKAQAKRAEARLEKVQSGLEEVTLWLQDLIRQGLANVPEKAHTYWQAPAARMVDAQASGVANMIKALDQINYYGHSWQTELLKQLSRIHLLVQGFKNLEQLPQDLQEDIRSMIGWSVQKDELRQQEGVRDQWFVLTQETEKEERLTIQRTWLYGQQNKKYALIINFYGPGQIPDFAWMSGMTYEATLVFYPGRQSLRAWVKEQHSQTSQRWPGGLKSLTVFENYLTERLAAFPWNTQLPVLLEGLIPSVENEQFFLTDQDAKKILLASTFTKPWLLLSISGGKSLCLAAMYQEGALIPMGVWHEDEFLVLNNA